MGFRKASDADMNWLVGQLSDYRFAPSEDALAYTLVDRLGHRRAVACIEPIGQTAAELHCAVSPDLRGDFELVAFARIVIAAMRREVQKLYAKARTDNTQALRLIRALGFKARHTVTSSRGEEFQIASLEGAPHAEG